MDEKRKIKDIYNCSYTIPEGEVYPLQSWYEQLINKSIDEIEVLDILRMIRQNEFLDLAISEAIKYLKKDPFVGDMYEGEVLDKLSEMDISYLMAYIDEIDNILEKALDENKTHEWLCEEEKDEFEDLIKNFHLKLVLKS